MIADALTLSTATEAQRRRYRRGVVTEDEAFAKLRRLLIEVDREAVLFDPAHVPLADIIDHDTTKPPPDGPYGRLTPLGWSPSGDGWLRCYETICVAGVERVVEVKIEGGAWGWRVDLYASRAGDYARTLRACLKTSRAELDLLPLVVKTTSPVREDPMREEEHIVGRANFTVTLACKREQRVLINVIERGRIDLASADGAATTSIPYDKE